MKKKAPVFQNVIEFKNFSCSYQKGKIVNEVLKNINLEIFPNKITTIIGRSGCGKSTLLWSINRLNELKTKVITSGQIFFKKKSIYDKKMSSVELRRNVGIVFQKPTPFPMSIFENISLALKISTKLTSEEIAKKVKAALIQVNLWKEVKDRLYHSATELSGGQQQKLAIARCIVNEPDAILMDEPTSSLDPISREAIEALIFRLKKSYTIILVTHSLSQASKISDYVVYLEKGEIIEFGLSRHFFTQPKKKATARYIQGGFGD